MLQNNWGDVSLLFFSNLDVNTPNVNAQSWEVTQAQSSSNEEESYSDIEESSSDKSESDKESSGEVGKSNCISFNNK